MTSQDPCGPAVDLFEMYGVGPVWGIASHDLNATLLLWPAGHQVAEHVNEDLDVLLVVLAGSGVAIVDGASRQLLQGRALLIERGASRAIQAGPDGIRYLSVHHRRGPLQIEP
jgi:quercetin dioxygenase-like cupin family protein